MTSLKHLGRANDGAGLRPSFAGMAGAPIAAQSYCLQHRFDEAARLFPERICLTDNQGAYTYQELLKVTSSIAADLAEQGVRRGDLVGLCVSRNGLLVAAMLAIHRVGAAYVPLDPAYPHDRLDFMIEDSRCVAVIIDDTSSGIVASLNHSTCVLNVNTTISRQTKWRNFAPVDGVTTDLSHVIYTSGSTGRPKAVAIEHHNVNALLNWAHATFSADEFSGMLASTSVCFDLSVFEIMAPLTTGGGVYIVENLLALANQPFLDDIRLVNTVPSVLREYLRLERLPKDIITVCAAGEAFPSDLLEELIARGVDRIFNLYGPSEDTTYSTAALLTRADIPHPPIGSVLPDSTGHILDDNMRPCASGEIGELYLGGAGLARGYLFRGGLTAERFTPNPFAKHPGERLYRTGDLVSEREDGALVYHGRRDQQVKLRGFRIELGEIETRLRRQDNISDAAVTIKKGPTGDDRLTAFISSPTPLNKSSLRTNLIKQLPSHMVPTLFIQLSDLPRLPNGKLNRDALPDPEWSETTRSQAPLVSISERLRHLWATVLGHDDIDDNTRFLDQGGDSLLAARVVARVRATFNVRLDIRTFFENQTLVGLSAWINDNKPSAYERPRRITARSASAAEQAPLSAAQRQMWFLSKLDPHSAAYNISAAIRLVGNKPDIEKLQRAWRSVLMRHETLRVVIDATDNGRPIQRVRAVSPATLPVRELSTDGMANSWEPIKREALALGDTPLNLENGDVLRAEILRTADEELTLIFAVHHAVFDEWSLHILTRDLCRFYHNLALPELAFSHREFCRRQQRQSNTPQYAKNLASWTRDLESVAEIEPLRFTCERKGAPPRGEAAVAAYALPRSIITRIEQSASVADVTTYMWLMSAFQLMVYAHSVNDRFIVGTAVADRSSVDAEELVGCFINTVPILANIRESMIWHELISQTRETSLSAFSRAHIPIEAIVANIGGTRNADASLFIRTAFGLKNGPAPISSHNGLTLKAREFENNHTRLPLTLWMDLRGAVPEARWTYDKALFTPTVIDTLHTDLMMIAKAALADPTQTISQLVGAINQTKTQQPVSKGSITAGANR